MKIHVGCDLELECAAATPLLLLVHVHGSREAHLQGPETLRLSPAASTEVLRDGQANRCCRLLAPAGVTRIHFGACVHDSGRPDPVAPGARQVPLAELPIELYAALNPSRYCDTDRLGPLAWSLFGCTEPGWSRVQAICDWVHDHIRFDYGAASDSMTAQDTLQRGCGVCRDFAHLAISFCRCLNIPARYCTGYLGYTGIPEGEAPVDFSAWMEVWLDGSWYVFDARHNFPRVGRVLIARGRDASDVPFLRSFGQHRLTSLRVITEAVAEKPAKPRPAAPFPHAGHATAPDDIPAGPVAP